MHMYLKRRLIFLDLLVGLGGALVLFLLLSMSSLEINEYGLDYSSISKKVQAFTIYSDWSEALQRRNPLFGFRALFY